MPIGNPPVFRCWTSLKENALLYGTVGALGAVGKSLNMKVRLEGIASPDIP